MKIFLILIIIIAELLFYGCRSFNYTYKPPPNENDGIETSSLEEFGIDSFFLDRLVNDIHNNKFINVHSVLVSKNNKLVFEEYFNGNSINTKHELRSASKSFTSAMVGIAIDKKLIKSSEERIMDLFSFYPIIDNWDKRKDKIKLKHLLTMTAGLDCGKVLDYESNCGPKIYKQKDPFKYVLDLPMKYDPGDKFSYNDGIPLLLLGIIGYYSKMSAGDFQKKYLYDPLGIVKDEITLGISARDMMKFGLLYLNGGTWKGKQIVSKEWVEESTKIHVSDVNNFVDGYGYYWWLKNFEVNNEIYQSYYAAGNGGQFIFIIPNAKLVVVLTGGNYVEFNTKPNYKITSQPFYILNDYILPSLNPRKSN